MSKIEEAIKLIRTYDRIDFMLESTGGKPSPAAKDAIENALASFSADNVVEIHVEQALEGFAGEDDLDCTVLNLAKSALAIAADEYAMEQLSDEWGGDVTDGCAFIAMVGS